MSGGGTQIVRYAPYLEAVHEKFLGSGSPTLDFVQVFNLTLGQSPYAGYEDVDIDEGFFGISVTDPDVTYEIRNFPSLWDMFGKFMAGLDLHDLWGQIYEDVVQGSEINNAVSAHSAMLQDEIDTNVLPRFLAGMRDINSVQATTFVVGKAIIQDAHVKAVNDFGTKLRIQAMNIAQDQWAKHLDWNKNVIVVFSEMMKLYYSARMDIDRNQLEYATKDAMWDINLFENARNILGAMAGGAASVTGNEPSTAQKVLGGAMSGGAAGATVGAAMGMAGLSLATFGIAGAAIGIASIFV